MGKSGVKFRARDARRRRRLDARLRTSKGYLMAGMFFSHGTTVLSGRGWSRTTAGCPVVDEPFFHNSLWHKTTTYCWQLNCEDPDVAVLFWVMRSYPSSKPLVTTGICTFKVLHFKGPVIYPIQKTLILSGSSPGLVAVLVDLTCTADCGR